VLRALKARAIGTKKKPLQMMSLHKLSEEAYKQPSEVKQPINEKMASIRRIKAFMPL
jgi:hypothetical protein